MKKGYIIGIIVLILIVGGVTWFLLQNKDDDKPSTPNNNVNDKTDNNGNYTHYTELNIGDNSYKVINGKMKFNLDNKEYESNIPSKVKYFVKQQNCACAPILALTEENDVYYTEIYFPVDYFIKKEGVIEFKKLDLKGKKVKDITVNKLKSEDEINCVSDTIYIVTDNEELLDPTDFYDYGEGE